MSISMYMDTLILTDTYVYVHTETPRSK
jgi:hypothetical protein